MVTLFSRAAQLFGTVEALLAGSAGHMEPPDQKEVDHYMTVVHSLLDDATFAQARAKGWNMTLEGTIVYALNESACE